MAKTTDSDVSAQGAEGNDESISMPGFYARKAMRRANYSAPTPCKEPAKTVIPVNPRYDLSTPDCKPKKARTVNPKYDLSAPDSKPENARTVKPVYDTSVETLPGYEKIDSIKSSMFQRGKERAELFLQNFSEKGFQSPWYFTENPELVILGEKGVSMSALEEAALGVNELVIDRFNLNVKTKIQPESQEITDLISGLYKGDTVKNDTRLAMHLRRKKSPDSVSYLIVTNKKIEGGWGFASAYGYPTITAKAGNIRRIAAHELMHHMELEIQGYTKNPDGNCKNDCLMNYSINKDPLCKPCNAGAVAYIQGVNSVLAKTGRKITKD